MSTDTEDLILYEVTDGIASVTMQESNLHNARSSKIVFLLDAAFRRAADDDSVKVIVLRSTGNHFSAGNGASTTGNDMHQFYGHGQKSFSEFLYVRELEAYLDMCRHWCELPKPTIAMVQGACIGDGVMIAWVCDLIIASEDAFFCDPVVRSGATGIEYIAHAYGIAPRIAKELLFLGIRIEVERAYKLGMVNRVVPREFLEEETYCIARRISHMPLPALRRAKQSVNHCADLLGKHIVMEESFSSHHLTHVHNEMVRGENSGSGDAHSMVDSQRAAGKPPA